MLGTDENVSVTVRVNSSIASESCIKILSEVSLCLKSRRENISETAFHFDSIFCDELGNNSQADVFENVGVHLTRKFIDGFNSCVFAYGQTGSGKTYSMIGSNTEAGFGFMPRFFDEMFKIASESSPDSKISFEISAYEVYNEKIIDLHDLQIVRTYSRQETGQGKIEPCIHRRSCSSKSSKFHRMF